MKEVSLSRYGVLIFAVFNYHIGPIRRGRSDDIRMKEVEVKNSKRNRIIGASIASLVLVGGITAGALVAQATEPPADVPAATATPTPGANGTNGTESTNGAESNGSADGNGNNGQGRRARKTNRMPVDPASVTVTETAAQAAAVAAVGGGEATRASLRSAHSEDANPVWRVTVTNGEQRYIVAVDAMTSEAAEPQARVAGEGRNRRARRSNGENGTNATGTAQSVGQTV